MRQPTFREDADVDFVVIGSGPAGSSVARELTRQGFDVVLMEQGKAFGPQDMEHDEWGAFFTERWINSSRTQPQTFRMDVREEAERRHFVLYANAVGGTTFHFTGNYWRFRPIDFNEFSQKGGVSGASLADWPITYEELEPYYSAVEWAIGVSGHAGAAPDEPPHSRPYPLPPINLTGPGVLLTAACRKLGWHSMPAPMALLSREYQGRQACHNCGFCLGFPCEWGAKSGANYTMVPEALATGRCELRSESYVRRIETNAAGRVTGVLYSDREGVERRQRAKAVVLSANGAESPRLLLMSETTRFPQGLANSSGMVGKNLMFNGAATTRGEFEHEVNGHRGPVVSRITHHTYELDPSLGFFGGGGFDFRFDVPAILMALSLPPSEPQWGRAFKQRLRPWYTNTVQSYAHTTSLPVETNSISLDPTLKDAWGMPAMRTTFHEHEHDLRMYHWFQARGRELLDAAGAKRQFDTPINPAPDLAVHLLGTCRMGNDAKTSVVDRYHRAHDVPNLFVVDGSSFVTSGRGQPTLTIQALAFRAADHIGQFAKRGEI
ncbi:MAG TPA: GMC family oxidoreductase [Gemmatimonadaceae bacterium]|nr:GMC family oxidoreductase [Gemmatimonadaceae bacterium]